MRFFKNQTKQKFIPKMMAIPVIFLMLLTGMVFLNSDNAYAAHDAALKECSIRTKEAACKRAVEACAPTNHACATNASTNTAISGRRVYRACQSAPDPQACDVKATDLCKPPTYATTTAITACRQKVADDLIAAAAGVGGAGAGGGISIAPNGTEKQYPCGAGDERVMTRFNFGCKGVGNPIVDITYTIIRFLTVGVGLVLAISIIFAGIMYTTSGGNPEQTSKAKERILNAMIGLLFYLLISALANFLIPGGLF